MLDLIIAFIATFLFVAAIVVGIVLTIMIITGACWLCAKLFTLMLFGRDKK